MAQPALGRAADVWGYPASYVLSGADLRPRDPVRRTVARRARASADAMVGLEHVTDVEAAEAGVTTASAEDTVERR